MSIALRCYVPAEVQAMGSWLPFAALMVGVGGVGDALRDDGFALLLSLLAVAVTFGLWSLLPRHGGDGGRGRLPLLRLLALVLAGIGAFSLARGSLSAWDLWARGWMLVPAGLVLAWTLGAVVPPWARGDLDETAAERGLARNRQRTPRLETVALHVVLVHAAAVIIVPVLWIFDVAVSPGNVLGGPMGDAFTLEHFERILGGSQFWTWTRNSLVIAFGTTLVGLALAVPAGYAYSRYDFAGRKGSMFAFMLVQMFPGIIILVPYFMVMKTLGLLNTSIGLIIVYSVTALPLCVWMLKGFFDTVPRALEEAALLDGCTQLEVFFRIILPLSLPAVGMTALFSFIAAWNEFLLALVFNTANERYTLPVGLSSLIPANGQLWGDFAAASIMVSIPVVVMFILFQRSLIQGLSAGSVKG